MKQIIVATLIIILSFPVKSQNWDSLGSGLAVQGPYTIYADTLDSYVYATGNFTMAGGVPVIGIARWNGTSWGSMTCSGALTDNAPNILAIIRYNGAIYAEGTFWGTSATSRHFVKWNGTCWDSLARIQDGINPGGFYRFMIYNNELYASGNFTSIGGVQANSLAKYNGTNWSALPGDTAWNYSIGPMAFYFGELYIGGGFGNLTTGMKHLAKWNGTNWVKPGGMALNGTFSGVADIVVYNNELYVAGSFCKTDGNMADNIQRWNGFYWDEVGGGMFGTFMDPCYGYVSDLQVHNNKLYAVGTFEYAGGVPADRIAMWDGTDWCGLGSVFNNHAQSITFKYNELYLGGGFNNIDGQQYNRIAKWIGGNYTDTCGNLTGINEITNENNISIYPNPTTGVFTVNLTTNNQQPTTIQIYNTLGELVYKTQITSNQTEINLSAQPKGIYFIKITAEDLPTGQAGKTYSQKLIIQ